MHSNLALRLLAFAVALFLSSPALTAPPATAVELWDYRVEPGDTLIALQARLLRPGARWEDLQKLNRIAKPSRLRSGSVLRIPLTLLRAEPVDAEVIHSRGEVFVERAGGMREPLSATVALRAGDTVSTGAQSSLSLRFVDGSTLLLGPQSRLRIDRHSRLGGEGSTDTQLRLDAGALETHVVPAKPAPRFELRTPVVNLGVRGTDLRSRVDGVSVLTEVLQGRVVVGEQALDAGFGTVATAAGVQRPQPLPAAPSLAALPSLVERLPLQLAFAAVSDAARYRAQLLDSATPPALLLDSIFDKPLAVWPDDLPDGRYELRVRAANRDGIEGLATHQAFTLKARPEPPFLLKPRAGEKLSQETVVFAWSRYPGAERYKLQVALTPDFAPPLVVDRRDLTDSEFSATLPPGEYHWRAATVLAGGDSGPWGETQVLTREPPPPPAPAAQPPEAGDAGVLLRWGKVPLPGMRYQVQVADEPSFAAPLVDETTEVAERLLSKPSPGLYYVRVRSISPDGRTGAYGQPQTVEVPSSSRWWLWLLPLLLLL